jgi:hypothetical protein
MVSLWTWQTLHGLVRLTAAGFSDLIINSTAFVGIELLHVTRVIAIIGTQSTPLTLYRSND